MKRFIQGYLTVASILIVLANLVLVFLYGRQFALKADEALACVGITCGGGLVITDFLILNGVLVGLFLIGWYTVLKVHQVHRQR